MAVAKAVTVSAVVYATTPNGVATLAGYSLRETAGSAAACRIRETDGSGKILATVALASGASETKWFGPQGLVCNGPLYFEKVSGTVEGAVFHG